MPTLTGAWAHADTVLWDALSILCFSLVACCTAGLLSYGGIERLGTALLQRIVRRSEQTQIECGLLFTPEVISPGQLIATAIGLFAVMLALLWLAGTLWLALLAGPLVVMAGLWIAMRVAERRYVERLDRALPSATARLSTLLQTEGLHQALRRMVQDLPSGPLRREWAFLLDRMGTPLADGGVATMSQVVAALRDHTPSHHHRQFLEHVGLALGTLHTPGRHDTLIRRVQAAAQALYKAEQQRSAAVTELAQMKYSGYAVGGTDLLLAVYLTLTQWERTRVAYGHPLGWAIGAVVVTALLAPLIGGVLFARTQDFDY